MWNGKFHIPIPIPEFWDVECGIVLLRRFHSNHAKVHWNVECGMEIHIPIPTPEFWNVECGIVPIRMYVKT
jgi:hypothetical protein